MATTKQDIIDQMFEVDISGVLAYDLLIDGKVHRFKPEGERRKKSAWYVLYEHTLSNGRVIITGAFGKGPETYKVRPSQTTWTMEERAEFKRQQAAMQKQAEKARAEEANLAAIKSARIWELFKDFIGPSPYLKNKQVKPFGLRMNGKGGILIPVRNPAGELRSIQYIMGDGSKRFNTGAEIRGNFHVIGDIIEDGWLGIGEGYATCATAHMATDLPVIVAFDAGNLEAVATNIKALYPKVRLLFIGDDDRFLYDRLYSRLKRLGIGTCPKLRVNGVKDRFECEVGPVEIVLNWETDKNKVRRIEGHVFIETDNKKHIIDIRNAGKEKAVACAKKFKTSAVFPKFENPEESRGTDFNDLHIAEGLDVVREQILNGTVTALSAIESAIDPLAKQSFFAELDSMLKYFRFIYGTNTLWDGRARIVIKVENLRLHAKKLTEAWLEHPDRKTIMQDGLLFDPTCKNDPERTVNLFDGFPLEPDNSALCQLVIEHLRLMCGGDEKLFDWVCKWLAYPLQYPGAKMRSALVVHGMREGTGKSMVFDFMRIIYGRYSKAVTQLQLQTEYTGWLSQLIFCVADEVVTQQDRKHHKGLLKSLITQPTVQIHEKFLPLREEKNQVNIVFLSNELQPLALDFFDRRYTVIYFDTQNEKEYFAKLDAEVQNGGAEAFYHFLLNYSLGDFNEFTDPYMNKAKQELIAMGMPAERKFYELWKTDFLEVPYCSCCACDLYQAFVAWCKVNGERFICNSTIFGRLVGAYEKKWVKQINVLDIDGKGPEKWRGMVYFIPFKKPDGQIEPIDDDVNITSERAQLFQQALSLMQVRAKKSM